MKAEEEDWRFDEGEDISDALDISKAKRVAHEQHRVSVDFPKWMVSRLDR
jgi:hypothetical protein